MFIFSNLAISLDGKIATSQRKELSLGSNKDRNRMKILRQDCDALLMGATTLRTYKKACFALGCQNKPIQVVLSSALEGVSTSWPFFLTPDTKRILLITQDISSQKKQDFEKTSEVVLLKHSSKGKSSIAHQVIQILEERDIQRLLIEGGGEIMWDFVSQNLINEYHVTLTPRIVGGEKAPTLVDGKGFKSEDILSLQLSSCERVGDELYLIYRKI